MVVIAGRRAVAAGLALAAAYGAGCANLEVKKVPLAERAAGTDREQGFRYYLNRPYIVVKNPIVICEHRSLVRVDRTAGVPAAPAGTKPDKPKPDSRSPAPEPGANSSSSHVQLTFLDGPRQDQTVRLQDLQVETLGTGAVRQVSAAELEKIHGVLKTGSTPPGSAPPKREVAMAGDNNIMINTAPPRGFAGASTDGNTGGGGDTSSQNTSSLDQPTVATIQHTPPLTGDIAILYLPDLDEQYAIKSCNLASKTAFGLGFRNGSELVEVQGEHDSTPLPLALLTQVQNAIQAVQGVEQARIQGQSKSTQTGGGLTRESVAGQPPQLVFQLIERTFIKPGVYRLNKPWEVEGDHAVQPAGCGLLAKLGLPTVVGVDFQPIATISP